MLGNPIIAEICWCRLVTSNCLLQEYLSFRHGHVASSKLKLENPESSVERVLEPPLDEIVAAHLRLVMNYFPILEQLENVTLCELLI